MMSPVSILPAQRSGMHAPRHPEQSPDSPSAHRSTRAGWRDPRLVVGIVLLTVSVVAGARIVGGADAMTEVLAARGPLAVGQPVGPEDVTTVRVRFADDAEAGRYLPGAEPLPAGTVVSRAVGRGELLPRAAVTVGGGPALLQVPLVVESGRVPREVRPGDRVDVWVTPQEVAGAASPTAALVLADVEVVSHRADGSGQRQVVVAVSPDLEPTLSRVVARIDTGSVLLLRR